MVLSKQISIKVRPKILKLSAFGLSVLKDGWMDGWMDGWIAVLLLFQSTSVISGRWDDANGGTVSYFRVLPSADIEHGTQYQRASVYPSELPRSIIIRKVNTVEPQCFEP